MKINDIRNNFPIFKTKINGKKLVYLDSANSSQKPQSVIDRMTYFYENEYSNIGRSVHSLAVTATNKFEETRDMVKKFINAKQSTFISKKKLRPIECVINIVLVGIFFGAFFFREFLSKISVELIISLRLSKSQVGFQKLLSKPQPLIKKR